MNSSYSADPYTQPNQFQPATFSQVHYQNPNTTRSNPVQPRAAPPPLEVSRPHSIAELAEMAKQSLGDDVRPFKTWLRIAETARRDAKGFQERGDLESAFIEFARAATIVLEKIPSHADYRVLLSQTQRHNMGLVSGLNQLAPYISSVPRITMRPVVCIYRPILPVITSSMFDRGSTERQPIRSRGSTIQA